MIIVTGAYSFTGKYVTQRLLTMGKKVTTLTGHPGRPSPFGPRVASVPYNFSNPGDLTKSLKGAAVLINTYWIRFPYGGMTYEKAVENTRTLISAAKEAGIPRIVHISITNPSDDSPFPYFRGKAMVETAVKTSGLSYAIIRPAVIFGEEGILINNIAWLLRHFPAFVIPGDGEYRIQPIFVEDLAEIIVDESSRGSNIVVDAVGPETYTFDGVVRLIAKTVRSRAMILHMNPAVAYLLSRALAVFVKDVMLTWDEVRGLMADLLVSHGSPTGETKLSAWLEENAEKMGTRYQSEVARHYA